MWISEPALSMALRVLLQALAVAPWLLTCWLLASHVPALAPFGGALGRARARARARSAGFRTLEPTLLYLRSWIEQRRTARSDGWWERASHRAGYPGGILPSEWIALTALATVAGIVLALSMRSVVGLEPLWCFVSFALVAALPAARLSSLGDARARVMTRALPASIDLIVLAMTSGCDLSQGLRFACDNAAAGDELLKVELEQLLEDLALGRSRSEALEALARRIGQPAFDALVASVRQAERSGSPLVEVLRIQAQRLRERRSVAAEEAVARATVKLMGPLVIMLGVVLCLVLGPMMMKGGGL